MGAQLSDRAVGVRCFCERLRRTRAQVYENGGLDVSLGVLRVRAFAWLFFGLLPVMVGVACGYAFAGQSSPGLERISLSNLLAKDFKGKGWTKHKQLLRQEQHVRRVGTTQTGRGAAAAATWIFCGDESRRRRGRNVEIPWRPVGRDADIP